MEHRRLALADQQHRALETSLGVAARAETGTNPVASDTAAAAAVLVDPMALAEPERTQTELRTWAAVVAAVVVGSPQPGRLAATTGKGRAAERTETTARLAVAVAAEADREMLAALVMKLATAP